MRPVHDAALGPEDPATASRVRSHAAGSGSEHAGTAPVSGSDPRLVHAGSAPAGLMALQRTAGNAAVAALVGGAAPVQRQVELDETTVEAGAGGETAAAAQAPAADAGEAGAAGAGGSPVTSDGATTTISGGRIALEAAMTEASGVLRADTVIADTIVASTYTPGAGNVW